jgi:hypothetical protein
LFLSQVSGGDFLHVLGFTHRFLYYMIYTAATSVHKTNSMRVILFHPICLWYEWWVRITITDPKWLMTNRVPSSWSGMDDIVSVKFRMYNHS